MRVIIPPRMQVNCLSECQLNCKFCANSKICVSKEKMCMGEFTDIIRKCVDFGIKEFELSPTIGEAFLDEHINERINLVASYDSVKKIKIFTNLLKEGPAFEALKCPKVELNVSIYGDNRTRYKARTGHDLYYLFVKNLRTLIQYIYSNRHLVNQVILYKRFRGDLQKPNLKDINDFSRWIFFAKVMKIQMWDSSGDTNWGKMLQASQQVVKDESRGGICKYAIEDNAVFPGGDISMCGWFDADRKLIIGNIHKQPLEEIYSIDSLFMKWLKLQDDKQYFGKCALCSIHKVQPITTTRTMGEIYENCVSDSKSV